MRHRRQLVKILVIEPLIPLGAHQITIQQEGMTKRLGLHHLQMLKWRLSIEQTPLDGQLRCYRSRVPFGETILGHAETSGFAVLANQSMSRC